MRRSAEVVAIWTENPVHNGTRYTWQSSPASFAMSGCE